MTLKLNQKLAQEAGRTLGPWLLLGSVGLAGILGFLGWLPGTRR